MALHKSLLGPGFHLYYMWIRWVLGALPMSRRPGHVSLLQYLAVILYTVNWCFYLSRSGMEVPKTGLAQEPSGSISTKCGLDGSLESSHCHTDLDMTQVCLHGPKRYAGPKTGLAQEPYGDSVHH